LLNIHIFVATNKGLVAIQNITDLQDSTLQSVITINGSTDLATISPAYHRFVQKSTGLIQSEFGGESFRANISRNIDQGMSWQLPFYLAHLVKSQEAYSTVNGYVTASAIDSSNPMEKGGNGDDSITLGQGMPVAGDVVLISTGQINTSTGTIEAVSHIPEKCITASAQIRLWMKKGILVEFFVPATSQKNTSASKINQEQIYTVLPELDCAIYQVTDTQQIKEHLSQLLPMGNRKVKQDIENSSQHSQALCSEPGPEPEPELIMTKPFDKLRFTSVFKKRNLYKTMIISLFATMLGWLILEKLHSSDNTNQTLRFVSTIKSGQHCDTNASAESIRVAEQYVARMPSVNLSKACSMTLITSKNTPQIWLVADTKTLIELSSVEIDNERHWTIPLPQQQSVEREYILVITGQYLDLADLAAFKSYLSRLETTQQPSVEILAAFFSQIEVNPQYLSQKLLVPNGQ
jgi:hypothetical protein